MRFIKVILAVIGAIGVLLGSLVLWNYLNETAEKVMAIKELLEDPTGHEGMAVIVQGKYLGPILRPMVIGWKSVPGDIGIEDNTGQINVLLPEKETLPPSLQIGDKIRVKGTVRVYRGPVGVDGAEVIEPYIEAVSIEKI